VENETLDNSRNTARRKLWSRVASTRKEK